MDPAWEDRLSHLSADEKAKCEKIIDDFTESFSKPFPESKPWHGDAKPTISTGTTSRNIRQATRSISKGGGKKRTPSLEELYGDLIKAGLVRIIRKKGKAPQVKFL